MVGIGAIAGVSRDKKTGPEAVVDLHFPGLAPAAAKWLVEHQGDWDRYAQYRLRPIKSFREPSQIVQT